MTRSSYLTVIRIILVASLSLSGTVRAEPPDHSAFTRILGQSVEPVRNGLATQVDYAILSAERTALNAYLNQLSAYPVEEFESWTTDEQLAFLINAYNAWTLELILREWPDLESIKEIGSLFQSPWQIEFIPLLGQTLSLDNIEHDLIRGSDRYQEPRIHFAVNCASIGCPALRPEAYTGDRLQMQLEEQTQWFLSDRTRNRAESARLEISPIFRWYQEDFERGWQGFHRLEDFLLYYADALGLSDTQKQALTEGDMRIRYSSYDWALNKPQ